MSCYCLSQAIPSPIVSSAYFLLDIDKYPVTSRSPWDHQCRGLVLSLFFHTHFFVLSIVSPHTTTTTNFAGSKGQILQTNPWISNPLCSPQFIGLASLLPSLSLLPDGVSFQTPFLTIPVVSKVSWAIYSVQIPNCKQILPEFCVMTVAHFLSTD